MSVTFSPTSREVRGGRIWIRGTVAFSSSASGGEDIVADDVDTGLTRLDYLKIDSSGANQFQYVDHDGSSGTIHIVDLTSGIAAVSGFSSAAITFLAIGQAEV